MDGIIFYYFRQRMYDILLLTHQYEETHKMNYQVEGNR